MPALKLQISYLGICKSCYTAVLDHLSAKNNQIWFIHLFSTAMLACQKAAGIRGFCTRARAHILGYISGYFVLLQHHSDIKYRIRISDISRFCSKWVDSPTGYSDISRFCSKWVDSPTGYSDVSRFCYRNRRLVLVQYLRPSSFADNDFISGYLSDIWRKNIGYFRVL